MCVNWFRKLVTAAFPNRGAQGQEKQFTSHCLRDTAACEWLGAGVLLERVSKLLGHKSVKTTERYYAKWIPERQEQLDNALVATWK